MAEVTQAYRISQLTTGKVGGDKFSNLLSKTITQVTEDDLAGVTTIPKYIFSGCELLEEARLPDSVIYLENYCFEDCYSLKRFKFSKNIEMAKGDFCNSRDQLFEYVDYNHSKLPIYFYGSEMLNYENCPYVLFNNHSFSTFTDENYCGESADNLTTPLRTFNGSLKMAYYDSYPYVKIPEGVESLTLSSPVYGELHLPSTLKYIVMAQSYGGSNDNSVYFPSEEVFKNIRQTVFKKYDVSWSALSSIGGKVYINGVDTSTYTEFVIPDTDDAPTSGLLSSFNNLEKLTCPATWSSINIYFKNSTQRENTEYRTAWYSSNIMDPNGSGSGETAYVPLSLKTLRISSGDISSYTFKECGYLDRVEISSNINSIHYESLSNLSESCVKVYEGSALELKSKILNDEPNLHFGGILTCSDGDYNYEQFNRL